MKFLHLIFLIGLLGLIPGAQGQVREWENGKIFQVNREHAQPYFVPYQSEDAATSDPDTSSALRLDLSGNWKFHQAERPEDRPRNFYKADFDVSSWPSIRIPSHNVNPEATIAEQEITKTADWHKINPVSSYRRSFDLPLDWKDKQVFIRLEGVPGAFYLWINGQRVGYSERSTSSLSFNISPFIQPGKNSLAVQVYRYSDNDRISLSLPENIQGIQGKVELIASSDIRIQDFSTETAFSADYTSAELTIKGILKNDGRKRLPAGQISYRLLDAKGVTVFSSESGNSGSIRSRRQLAFEFKKTINNPILWSTEKPYLYTLLISLKDRSGEVQEVIRSAFGFRDVKVDGNKLLVNGKETELRGVSLNRDALEKDFIRMKRNNVNAIRLHYPAPHHWYELCDQYGLYLIAGADLDIRDTRTNSKNEGWQEVRKERQRRLVQNGKNHASVIMWSAMDRDLVLGMDPGRPIQSPAIEQASDKFPVWKSEGANLSELSRRYQPIATKLTHTDPLSISLKNDFNLTNLEDFVFEWQLLEDGRLLQQGLLPTLSAEPGQTITMQIPVDKYVARPGFRYHLNFFARTKSALPWAPAGYGLASEQLELLGQSKALNARALADTVSPPIVVLEKEDQVLLIGQTFHIGFSRLNGTISSLAYYEQPVISDSPATDTVMGNLSVDGQAFLVEKISPERVQIQKRYAVKDSSGKISEQRLIYEVNGNGMIQVRVGVDYPDFSLKLDSALSSAEWLGKGACNDESGDNPSSFFGRYNSPVDRIKAPMNEVEWIALTGRAGNGLLFIPERAAGIVLGKERNLQIEPQASSVSFKLIPFRSGQDDPSAIMHSGIRF